MSEKEQPVVTDVAEMRRLLENGMATDIAARNMLIKTIKAEFTSNINRGIPVSITEQMRELGIAQELTAQMKRAELWRRWQRRYRDEDDPPEVSVDEGTRVPIFL